MRGRSVVCSRARERDGCAFRESFFVIVYKELYGLPLIHVRSTME